MGSAPLIQLTRQRAMRRSKYTQGDLMMTRMTGGGAAVVARESIVNLLSRRPRPAVRPPGRARARSLARSLLSQNFPRELGLRPRERARAFKRVTNRFGEVRVAGSTDDKLADMIRAKSQKIINLADLNRTPSCKRVETLAHEGPCSWRGCCRIFGSQSLISTPPRRRRRRTEGEERIRGTTDDADRK